MSLLAIKIATAVAADAPGTVESHNEVAETVVVESGVEVVVVPTSGASQRIIRHRLEQGSEMHHAVQSRHIGVGQIDGTSPTACGAGIGTIEVDAGNDGFAVELATQYKLLGVATGGRFVGQMC